MEIIKESYYSHPEEQLTDIVKLLFQRYFGPEHMIKNPASSLARLETELENVDYDKNTPLFEDIGGDFARINLAAVKGLISSETVNRIFVISANGERKPKEEFVKTLETLKNCSFLPFSKDEINRFIAEYISLGCPALSHSDVYREKYAPHYRVAQKKYAYALPLFIEIESVLKNKGAVAVGIDGMAASGKTTLAKTVAEIYDCNVFHCDDYFLRPEQKTPARLAETGGNIDYERLKSEIIDNLLSNKDFEIRKYDCETETLSDIISVPKKSATVIEGVYALHPYFGDVYDIKRVLKISKDEQLARLEKRNPALLDRFITDWLPKEEEYFEIINKK